MSNPTLATEARKRTKPRKKPRGFWQSTIKLKGGKPAGTGAVLSGSAGTKPPRW